MNNIDKLIQQLCPDGVEYSNLGEVAKISNGKDHKNLPDGHIPVYGSGGIMRYANEYIFDKESVLIPRKGSIGNIFYVETPFWTVDTIFYTKINCDLVSPKFLYYFLKTQHLEDLNFAGGVPSLTKTILDKVNIPIPPLPIQQEIVTILDKFTQLQAELQAELQARRAQYEYYRNDLLNFEGKEVEWKTLGEVGEFVRGNGLQKKDFTETGIGCIHYGQIYTYYGTFAHKTKTFVSPEFAKKLRKAKKGDLVIATTSENVEDVCKTVAWLGDDEIAVSGDAFIYKHNQNPMYLAYFLQTPMFFDHKKKYMTGTKVIRVSGKDMAKFKIPIPPLAEQNRIVAILDKFDKLVNDISEGLPAEIQARQKQYEYYRGKLLEFKCLSR
ncbi:MAG: restriction endonuclease subunit S [Bacteroidetes bacterium]|nr:restriction endonuclease subunit S [Bacteroidota bacterium]